MQVQFSFNLGADFHVGNSARDRPPVPEIVEAVPVSFVENDRADSGRSDPDREHDSAVRARLLEQRTARRSRSRLPAPRKKRKETNHRGSVPSSPEPPRGILTFAFTAGLDLGLPPTLDVIV